MNNSRPPNITFIQNNHQSVGAIGTATRGGGDDDSCFERMVSEALGGLSDLSDVNTVGLFMNEQPLTYGSSFRRGEQDITSSYRAQGRLCQAPPPISHSRGDRAAATATSALASSLSSYASTATEVSHFLQQAQAPQMASKDSRTTPTTIDDCSLTAVPLQHHGHVLHEPRRTIFGGENQQHQESDGYDEDEDGGLLSKPKRSLSAYNFFFAAERKKLLKSLPPRQGKRKPRNSHGKLGFADMARTISAKWKKITPEEKVQFTELAKLDGIRYRTEMAQWKQNQHEKALAKMQMMLPSSNHSFITSSFIDTGAQQQQPQNDTILEAAVSDAQNGETLHVSAGMDQAYFDQQEATQTINLYLQTFGM